MLVFRVPSHESSALGIEAAALDLHLLRTGILEFLDSGSVPADIAALRLVLSDAQIADGCIAHQMRRVVLADPAVLRGALAAYPELAPAARAHATH